MTSLTSSQIKSVGAASESSFESPLFTINLSLALIVAHLACTLTPASWPGELYPLQLSAVGTASTPSHPVHGKAFPKQAHPVRILPAGQDTVAAFVAGGSLVTISQLSAGTHGKLQQRAIAVTSVFSFANALHTWPPGNSEAHCSDPAARQLQPVRESSPSHETFAVSSPVILRFSQLPGNTFATSFPTSPAVSAFCSPSASC
mmetsp:Transcript_99074/g.171728  ORF Transcript_99074/g.171728 Transcript_99074/m.171728 type:complete len:203 (-) Transcript_99074:1065-1673(-)